MLDCCTVTVVLLYCCTVVLLHCFTVALLYYCADAKCSVSVRSLEGGYPFLEEVIEDTGDFYCLFSIPTDLRDFLNYVFKYF